MSRSLGVGKTATQQANAIRAFAEEARKYGKLTDDEFQNIAGLVNREGTVLGMMPHPERRVSRLLGGEDGRALVRALVEAA